MHPAGMVLRQAIDQNLNKLGLSSAGHAWALKALHPCDESKTEIVPIPDNATADVACFETRHSRILSVPPGVNENWDCQLAVVPTFDVPIVFRTKASSTDVWGKWLPILSVSPSFAPGLVEIATGGTPFSQIQDAALNKNAEEFRQLFRGMTVVHNASSLANQGMVTAGQWGVKWDTVLEPPAVSGAGTTPDPIQFLVFTDIPSDDDGIIVKCPEASQWEAKQGVYMPMRFNEPTHLFTKTGGSEITPVGSNTAVKIGMPIILSGASDSWSILNDSIQVGSEPGTLITPTTAGPVNLLFGTCIFSGLDKTAQLVIKLRSGIEFVPISSNESVWATKTRSAEDTVAIKNVQIIGNKIPAQFPHKYNSLGWLLPLIKQAAKGAWAIAAPWLGQKVSEW